MQASVPLIPPDTLPTGIGELCTCWKAHDSLEQMTLLCPVLSSCPQCYQFVGAPLAAPGWPAPKLGCKPTGRSKRRPYGVALSSSHTPVGRALGGTNGPCACMTIT